MNTTEFVRSIVIAGRTLCVLLVLSSAMLVSGCGGSSGSGSTSISLSGTVAAGAPLTDATVTITDANGATVTATVAADGTYSASLDPVAHPAPYVIVATGEVQDVGISLVSMQATAVNATVNVTPITTAIAATLATGTPTSLTAADLTAQNVTAAEQAYRDVLSANIAAPSQVNLISTAFTAGSGAGLDLLLDNVKVNVTTSGEVQMSSTGGVMDGAAPTALILPPGTSPSAGQTTSLPASATPFGVDLLETARLALNACFALTSTQRTATPTPGTCANLVDAAYLHSGRNASQEFNALLADAGNDAMTFRKPEIIRQIDATQVHVKLVARRGDGLFRALDTVAKNFAASGATPVVRLYGNQRRYESHANLFIINLSDMSNSALDRYEGGLRLYVPRDQPNDAEINYVTVTGKNLPSAGIKLVKKTGCDLLTIDDGTGSPPLCSALFRLRSVLKTGADFTPTGNTYLFTQVADTGAGSLAEMLPFEPYTFTFTLVGGGTQVYINRLRARPPKPAEVALMRFAEFAQASKDLMAAATLYTGGTKPTLAWTVPQYAMQPKTVGFFHAGFSDIANVPFAVSSKAIPCSGNADCSGVNGDYNTGLVTTGQFRFQLQAHDTLGTYLFTQVTP